MYGLQYQRSYSTGVMVAGSRSENESAGFVRALTIRVRYCPGRLDRSCATANGARMALSSLPPVETTPATVRVCIREPAATVIVLPTCKPRRCARLEPNTISLELSVNHRP